MLYYCHYCYFYGDKEVGDDDDDDDDGVVDFIMLSMLLYTTTPFPITVGFCIVNSNTTFCQYLRTLIRMVIGPWLAPRASP